MRVLTGIVIRPTVIRPRPVDGSVSPQNSNAFSFHLAGAARSRELTWFSSEPQLLEGQSSSLVGRRALGSEHGGLLQPQSAKSATAPRNSRIISRPALEGASCCVQGRLRQGELMPLITGGDLDHVHRALQPNRSWHQGRWDLARRLDVAKKLLADMGGEMKQFYMVMGEFDFVRVAASSGRRRHGALRPAARRPRLRTHEDTEGFPRDRLPRNFIRSLA